MGKDKLSRKQQLMAEQQQIFKNRKVVQLNRFIKGDVSAFSVNDLKIFKLIISKVDSKESLFKDFYEITTDEIKALNINSKHLYNETRKTLKRLANIYITFDEGDSVREVGLIRNDFKFEKYSKKILINFNDDMGDYLINLKKNFFMYDLIDIVNFKFKHTLKFYEYLKSQSLNVIKLKIETLKEILDLTDKYKRYTNFKSDVLEVILEEINECSNTLYVSYSEEKVGPKVKYIIFHIKRIKSDLVIDAPKTSENKYFNLIGLECEYLNKYQMIDNIDLEHNLIVLKELHTENYTNIVKDSDGGLADTLKKLLGSKYDEKVGQGEQNEVERLLAAKDFKKFKDEVIKQYKGKILCNNVPGYLPEVKISVEDETGYLFNEHSSKILTKEKSLEVWRYLYKNKKAVGKITEINPVKEFLDVVVIIQKTNMLGNKESVKYIITDIQKEVENETEKYRLYLQDALDPLQEVEKSKSLLNLEQLKKFVEMSRVED